MIDAHIFKKLCEREGYATDIRDESIGIYNEKRLHRILKNALCERESCHEVKVGRYVADILEDGVITEIQCAATSPLLQKLKYYLGNTDYSVRVIIPYTVSKKIIRADRKTGEILRIRSSPLKEGEYDALAKLYPLRELLSEERISVCLAGVKSEEYRYSEPVRYRKKGKYDSDLFPQELCCCHVLKGIEDYKKFLPKELYGTEFTAAQFGKATRTAGINTYSVLNILFELGILSREKRGRGMIYTVA